MQYGGSRACVDVVMPVAQPFKPGYIISSPAKYGCKKGGTIVRSAVATHNWAWQHLGCMNWTCQKPGCRTCDCRNCACHKSGCGSSAGAISVESILLKCPLLECGCDFWDQNLYGPSRVLASIRETQLNMCVYVNKKCIGNRMYVSTA